jgi:fructuronate reductase
MAGARADQPRYDRSTVTPGIVHLGLGAFSRAHLCVYVDELLARGQHHLGVVGVSLRNDDVPNALAPQDGLYTLAVIAGGHLEPRVVGSVIDVLHAPTRSAHLRTLLAAPTTTLVTVTVTEKGYCWLPAARSLDPDHPDVVHDRSHPDAPRSLPGHLVRMAADRRESGRNGITVLSLDNLPSNGRTLRSVVRAFADLVDPTLTDWIDEHLRFPCSMVDRIVPATDERLRSAILTATGLDDASPVRAEPYSQWVVERDWAATPPDLEAVGVTLVDDVEPWERLKLRVVNGLHTCAAHVGLFHGIDTIDAVVAHPAGHTLLERVAAEVTEVLDVPAEFDLGAYVDTTFERFANTGLAHRCAQIATDTSQKLPQRLLDTLRLRLARGLGSPAILDTLALWAWSTLGVDHLGRTRAVHDPLGERFAAIAAAHAHEPVGVAAALFDIESIFGDLTANPTLVLAVGERLRSLLGSTAS